MKISKLASALLLAFVSMSAAHASPTYTYVGSWKVNSGAWWSAQDANGNYTTKIYSGVEAAAAIFGGSASSYVTSTVGPDVTDINFMAWYDGYGQNATMFADTWHADPAGSGLYAVAQFSPTFVPTWSAWVADHGYTNVNYAFSVTESADVPEPTILSLLGLGMAGLALSRRKAKQQ